MRFVTIFSKLRNKTIGVSFCQLTFMSVMFACFLQNSKNAKQCFSLTANHSCWDWVRRRERESEGEERLKQRVREGKCRGRRRTNRISTGKRRLYEKNVFNIATNLEKVSFKVYTFYLNTDFPLDHWPFL